MGCGDDWPLCNGHLIPPLDLPTLIEYAHRLVAAAVSVVVVALVALSFLPGRGGGWRTRRRLSCVALAMLVVQVLLGAVTVWLELPPVSVILHLATAVGLLAVLIVVASEGGGRRRYRRASDRATRLSRVVAGLGFLVVLAGALVANLDAAPACQGFPLCNGRWWPAGGWRIHLHWAHRALAYLLVACMVALPGLVRRWRPEDGAVRKVAALAAALGLGQLVVAAAMVLLFLPAGWQAAHLALGTGIFATLVRLAWMTGRPRGSVAVRW